MRARPIALLLAAVLCLVVHAHEAATIVPTPVQLIESTGTCKLDTVTVDCRDAALLPAAQYLAQSLAGRATVAATGGHATPVKLALDTTLEASQYRLDIAPGHIDITGGDYSGVACGIATLRQLLPAASGSIEVPCLRITDKPRYSWRGLLLDSSRHFWSVDEVKRLLDLMACYKLNRLHWHLVDDEGWRIEIKRYPQLTGQGAFRPFDSHDLGCEERAAREHNADLRVDRAKMKVDEHGDSVYGGYYTQRQLRDVVAYARERGIEIMPEVDFPGHSRMATTVLPWLSCQGEPSSTLCVGSDSTLQFCKNVYDEVFDIFPFAYVHMGGDEVDKRNWQSCPRCQQRMRQCGIASIEGLQGWFVRQLEAYFNAKGRHLVGWDEIADDGLGTGSVVQWWRGWNKGVVERATVQGKQVICSPTTCLYFDYGQDDGTIDEILRYDPRSTAGLSAGQQQLILGMQGNTWCEWIATEARLQYQVMPRMIALAERAWTSDTCRERVVARFHEKLPAQLERLDALHVRYKLPDITGVSEHTLYNGHGVLWPAIAYGKATLRYTTDGTVPTCQSPAITGPVEVTRDTHFTIARSDPTAAAATWLPPPMPRPATCQRST
jgi:hexosaminidase